MTETLLLKQILFLSYVLNSQPLSDQISIPVEISQGGTVRIEAQDVSAPLPAETELKLQDCETGSFTVSFLEQGEYTYRLKQLPSRDPYMKMDETVYILHVKTAEDGKLENVFMYAEGSDEKTESAHWQNRTVKPSADTSDPGYIKGYLILSTVSLLITMVLFKAAGGADEEY